MYRSREVDPDRGRSSQTPRILAVGDVHLSAATDLADAVARFYTELIGLDPMPADEGGGRLCFRGHPRSGPCVRVDLVSEPPKPSNKRQLLVHVAGLFDCRQRLLEWGIPHEWARGWSYYDRRLCLQDPAGNRIELVAYHELW
ncbi:MAG TPA: hypothetical protein VLM89_12570 [Phycisphaerae bacterium]|nr:hypothetical protein [Phycisphaerae bacterium]